LCKYLRIEIKFQMSKSKNQNGNSEFKRGVVTVVSKVPYGKVVSYGQVALYVGVPRAARQVGWILNQLEDKTPVPWWRVVNNEGRISIKASRFTAEDQRQLLVKEGVDVGIDLTFDIESFRFVAGDKFVEEISLDPTYLEMISDKLPYSKYFRRGR
jgi:methylated-DNA-protein-cysteine methyltransferase related protein